MPLGQPHFISVGIEGSYEPFPEVRLKCLCSFLLSAAVPCTASNYGQRLSQIGEYTPLDMCSLDLRLFTICQLEEVSVYHGCSRITGLSGEGAGTTSIALLLMDVDSGVCF